MFLAIDIGGTNVRAAVSTSLDNPELIDQVKIPNEHDFDQYMKQVIEFAKKQGKIKGVGISITADINEEGTMAIATSPNAPEVLNQPIVELLEKELGCPVYMDNDGTVSALGEARYAREGAKEFIFVIWGTGIGGARATREKGKIKVDQIDWYEHFEDWENDCGGEPIKSKHSKPPEELTEEEWREVEDKMKKHLLVFSGNLKTSLIVFGGGIALNQPHRVENIKKDLGRQIPNISLAKLGDEVGLFGAFALIKQKGGL